MPEPRPAQVSCLALTFFYDWLESQQMERDLIQADLPYPPAHLDDRTAWIDFETFLRIEQRVADLFPDEPDLFFRIGSGVHGTKSMGFLMVVMRTMLSPIRVYGQIPRFIPRFLFPFVDIRFERTGRSAVRGRYAFHEGFVPSEAFLQTVRGILSGLPATLGAPPATVQLTRESDRVAVFEVVLQRWLGPGETVRGLWGRVWGALRARWRSVGDAAAELEQSNALLQDKVAELSVAKAALDRRVGELTALNRVADTTGRDLDLRRLVRQAVQVLHAELGQRTVVLVLLEGPTPVLAAAAGLGADCRRKLDAALAAGGGLDPVVHGQRRHDTLALGGAQWSAVGLVGRTEALGALLLAAHPEGICEEDFLCSLAGQLAPAIDNARSYRVIADLRDNLELRVRQRTAQLEDAHQQLEETVARLERADRAQKEFFSNVSHELKTPLTLILAPLDDIETTLVDNGLRGVLPSLANLRRNAANLQRMVEELLDLARMDEGRLPVRRTLFDLARLVGDTVDSLRPLAERRRIAIAVVQPEAPVSVMADPKLVRRVVHNLVGNALKYIRDGDRVTVTVDMPGDTARLVVADTGPGIPQAHADRVFERFQRAWSNTGGRYVEGSGIGLAMTRELVQLHAGTIRLVPGGAEGACFEVVLPRPLDLGDAVPHADAHLDDDGGAVAVLSSELEGIDSAAAAAALPADIDPGDAHGRILLVEDNAEMRAFMVRLLGDRYAVRTARDGEEGVAMAQEMLPDLVLSDVMMPRLDGYGLCRALKADALTRSIPVILVSARHGSAAAMQGFEAGAEDFVVKPFSAPELRARIDAQIRLRALTLALVQAEKRSQLGIMSAGIAHEVLNPVNAIVNAMRPLRRLVDKVVEGGASPAKAKSIAALLGAVESSGHRIRSVVDGVLSLARQGEGRAALIHVDLAERVDGVLDVLAHRVPPGVTVHRQVPAGLQVECFADLCDQVIMNLVGNAVDAVDPRTGQVWVWAGRAAGRLTLRVRDDGPGIPAHERDKVFAPFFTTKDPGKGTGLGLAVCQEIATMHRGELSVGEAPGGGAEFVFSFPVRGAREADHDLRASA